MQLDVYEAAKKIHQKLNLISEISLDELLIIKNIIHIVGLNPGDYFIEPGQSAQKIAFIISGLLRTYYIMDNGKEYISHFGHEGSFVGVYTDMLKNTYSTGYIQALEPSTLLVMDYHELLRVTKNSIQWAHFLRAVAETRYIMRAEKDRNITLKTAIERYEYFTETNPHLINRISGHQIALYLNLTPATLSRLKNKSGKYKK